jgi:hypothetical protein
MNLQRESFGIARNDGNDFILCRSSLGFEDSTPATRPENRQAFRATETSHRREEYNHIRANSDLMFTISIARVIDSTKCLAGLDAEKPFWVFVGVPALAGLRREEKTG